MNCTKEFVVGGLRARILAYWSLIKSMQTGLLLLTGLAGYMSAQFPLLTYRTMTGLMGSLALAIGGSTVLNMFFDRDIDSQMSRTCNRPLPTGLVSPSEALALGTLLSLLGVGWSFLLFPLYGGVVLAGLIFDVAVYTIWLKRRTAWSIVWGGIAGGMPVLAGRVLGTGTIDLIGLTLALAVVLWIPAHILTFTLRNQRDYRRAGIPTFPSTYGEIFTRRLIALASVGATAASCLAANGVGMTWGYLRVLLVLSSGLFLFAVSCLLRPSSRTNFALFKYASFYMMGFMLLLVADGL